MLENIENKHVHIQNHTISHIVGVDIKQCSISCILNCIITIITFTIIIPNIPVTR